MMVKRNVMLAVGVALLVLSGCGSQENDVRQELDQMTKDVKGRIPPLPVVRPYEPFTYLATGVMDPFSPMKISAKFRNSGGPQPNMNRKREFLESFPLDTIKMVGAVKMDGVKNGVVMIDGMTYKVRVGSHMGQNMGQVVAVNDGSIVLKELLPEGDGWVEKVTEVTLQGTNEGPKK